MLFWAIHDPKHHPLAHVGPFVKSDFHTPLSQFSAARSAGITQASNARSVYTATKNPLWDTSYTKYSCRHAKPARHCSSAGGEVV